MDDETLRLRRGIGSWFVCAAALHLVLMSGASLYAGGMLPGVAVSAARWSQLFFGHFLFLILAPLGYLGWHGLRTRRFVPQALVDVLTGLLIYLIFFAIVGLCLVTFKVTPWISLIPGVFLFYYGARVRHGRQIWALLDI